MRKNIRPVMTFAKTYCAVFGHRFQKCKSITDHVHEYKCANCKLEMTDTADGLLTMLTPEFRETNSYLAQYHKKRRRKFHLEISNSAF